MGAEEHPEGSQTEHLRPLQNVFALGDCCANIGTPLPALAQVRSVQAQPSSCIWFSPAVQHLGQRVAAVCMQLVHL